jgi:hypothetical protein
VSELRVRFGSLAASQQFISRGAAFGEKRTLKTDDFADASDALVPISD